MSRRDNDDALMALAVLGGLFMLSRTSAPIPWGIGWVFPVPDLHTKDGQVYQAAISQEFRRTAPPHLGVDIMYRRHGVIDRPEYGAGTPDGNTQWFMPLGTPVLAARDARVWSVIKGPRGWAVVLDHGAPFATFYQHLDRVDFEPHAMGKTQSGKAAATVKAGDMFGTCGWSGEDPSKLRHLHFAAWYKGNGDNASVDPTEAMATWKRVAPWNV